MRLSLDMLTIIAALVSNAAMSMIVKTPACKILDISGIAFGGLATADVSVVTMKLVSLTKYSIIYLYI